MTTKEGERGNSDGLESCGADGAQMEMVNREGVGQRKAGTRDFVGRSWTQTR